MEYKHMVVPFELKKFDEEEGIFTGYASVFGNEDAAGDVMMKGAFTNSLKNPSRIKILNQHRMDELPIGKPISMFEDERGLFVEGKISDTTDGRDIKTLIKDGVFTEMSIGYTVAKDRLNGKNQRELLEINLFEFSPVTFACNDKALISSYKNLEGGDEVSKAEDEEEEKVKVSDEDEEDEEEKATKNPERMEAAFAKIKEGMKEISDIMGTSSKAEDEDEDEEDKVDDEDEDGKQKAGRITEKEEKMLLKNIRKIFEEAK